MSVLRSYKTLWFSSTGTVFLDITEQNVHLLTPVVNGDKAYYKPSKEVFRLRLSGREYEKSVIFSNAPLGHKINQYVTFIKIENTFCKSN